MGDAFNEVAESLDELIESFFTTPMYGNEQFGFTVTIFWFLVACALLLFMMFHYSKKMQGTLLPKGTFCNAVEFMIDFVRDDICINVLGETWKEHFPFLATVFLVVLFGDYIGMLPFWKAGTATTGVTFAIALMSFAYFIYIGMKKKGVFGYIKSLAPAGLPGPIAAVVWVIELFSTFLRLITLAVRLFCNMFAGHVVMGVFAVMCTVFVSPLLEGFSATALGMASMSGLWLVLLILLYAVELLVAFIQAYIFTLLSAVYIQLAQAEEH